MGMRHIIINDLEKLRDILESPSIYEYYRQFIPPQCRVVSAELGMYEHPDGAVIRGRPGRYWVFIRVYYAPVEGEKETSYYDIALWKLALVARHVWSLLAREGIITVAGEEKTLREETETATI